MTRITVAMVLAVLAGCRASGPATSAAAPSNSTRTATSAGQKDVPVADVRLELLKTQQTDLEPTTRNPFQFKAKAAPPAPKPTETGGRAPVIIAPPPAPAPVGPPPPPPIALKYIGVLDTAQGRVAVFRGTDDDIVNGKEGDIIEGRYRLLKIGVESADLAYVDGRGRQTIRLSGQ